MIELNGKYNTARVYIDSIDQATISQIINFCNLEFLKDSKIRIMPDCHAGKGCTVGTTMTILDKVIPSTVGCDIGCGMLVVPIKEKRLNMPVVDNSVKNAALGKLIKSKHVDEATSIIEELRCLSGISISKESENIGSLGGGNHFIEIDVDDKGNNYLVIHTGSRHLGIKVEAYYSEKTLDKIESDAKQRILDDVKNSVPRTEIDKVLKNKMAEHSAYFKANRGKLLASVPCEGSLFDDYIHDMEVTQRYAALNRKILADLILKDSKLHEVDVNSSGISRFETVHNYIETSRNENGEYVLRKGAVSAKSGERLIIPINMRDGSLLCTGKGNIEWNQSAPHGAGRLYSRSEAKEKFTVNEYKYTMAKSGIYTTSANEYTLDECPMAYKSMNTILENIKDTVTVDMIIRPIYNYKSTSLETWKN